MRNPALLLLILLELGVSSCGPSSESSSATESKEMLYRRGHQRYLRMEWDAAETDLRKAIALDSSYREALVDLGSLMYDRAYQVQGEKDPVRVARLREAQRDLTRAEASGARGEELYERLCEITSALKDDRSFLKYAKKTTEQYPGDRQYYNLGVAYEGLGDWQGVVKSQKEALERYKESPYVGGFYRQIGRAYMKMDRNQTAEKILTEGLTEIDRLLVRTSRKGGVTDANGSVRRLENDKIAVLLLLKQIHTLYGDREQLESVERQLKEAGYSK